MKRFLTKRDLEETMTRFFDLIVIGTGAAAAGVASRCQNAGWQVVIVDALPYGGTCQLRGCDPKKVLVGAAEAMDWVRRLQGKGIDPGSARIDWPTLMQFKQSIVDPAPEGNESWLAGLGVETLHGQARFISATTVDVEGEHFEAKHVHLATGAVPADLKILGQEHMTTSTGFLDLESLPARIVFVGGGFISFEFAHISARAGAGVTILHRGVTPLKGFDPDLVAMLVEKSRGLGIEIQLEAEVREIRETENGFEVVAATPEGEKRYGGDLVVHGAGRSPNIEHLGLDAAGVVHGPRGVEVNEYMQSVSNPAVFAAGDCADTVGLPLTPVGAYEGGIAAQNMLEGNRHTVSHPPMPSAVFTIPPLATVGLQESEARKQGLRFETQFGKTGSWYSSKRIGEDCSGYKILVEAESGKILGAHILGPNAEELINLFTMAINASMSADAIKDIIFAYPTYASDMGHMV